MHTRFVLMLLVGAPVVILAPSAGTTSAALSPQPVSRASDDRAAIVEQIATVIRANSAFPDKSEALIARLRASLASGRYDVDDRTFASRMTDDLLAVSGDKHLYLVSDPAQQTALSNSTRPADEAIASPTGIWAARFRRENHGLVEQRILEGNVRYLNITAFDWTHGITSGAYDDAMRFLREGDAIIIDLRRNPGGTPDAVRYLLSYFATPGELLATFYQGSKIKELRAYRRVPGGPIFGKPLYVLVSPMTASASEEFAYYVANHRLGEVVGVRTAGAGNVKGDYPIAPGFVLSLSVARSVDPFTHSNWEGVGVAPSVPTAVQAALITAHARALERLSATVEPGRRHALSLDLRLARSRVHPAVLSTDQLGAYAGSYGDRRIRVANGRLMWQRGEQVEIALEPLGNDWFQLGETGSQAHFQIVGSNAVSVTISRSDGDGVSIPRSATE